MTKLCKQLFAIFFVLPFLIFPASLFGFLWSNIKFGFHLGTEFADWTWAPE
jgi:hypothetical protein